MRGTLLIIGSLAATSFLNACAATSQAPTATPLPVEAEIRQVEEQFRAAKVGHDVDALTGLLHQDFAETNQNGNTRNRAELLELFKTFPIASLTTDSVSVRVAGNIAVVNGAQTERSGGIDRMLFTRVYVRDGGSWQLISSAQFRDPR